MSSANLIEQSDFIVMLGTRITLDNRTINESVDCAIKNQGAEFIYMHPIDDVLLEEKYTQFIKYEVGSEEAVVAMLAFYLLEGVTLDNTIKEYLVELDMGYLSGESSVGEEECEDIVQKLANKKSKILIIGSDLYTHERATNIAKLLGLINKYTDFEIIMIPNNSTSQKFETTMLNSNDILEEIAEIDS
ncbi:MAG TPA: hypothetical protein ENK66_07850, partial [Arcobacter sp.]|nr:hypothetical protein [Arcobacter sp.]